jgi:branched-chain amino acid transport system permease protein
LIAFSSFAATCVFLTELTRRIFAQDYMAIAKAAGAGGLPAITLFGWDWSPASMVTWTVPVVLVALGIACWKFANVSIGGLMQAGPVTDNGAIKPTPGQVSL